MVFIDLVQTEEAKDKLLGEWRRFLKKTEFYVSSKVIDETFGVMINRLNIDPTDVRNKINKVKQTLKMQVLGFDKKLDNRPGFQLLEKYRQEFGDVDIDEHINDGRIIAHLKRKGINIVYSREELVRKLAELVGMEGRDFILSKFHQKSQ